MSRGFVKEDDQEEAPIIPPRAALPAGETNYVTPNGLKELKNEEEALIEERANLDKQNDTERRRAQAVIDGKLKLLRERISTARLLKPEDQPADEVRFGALVELMQNGNKQEFQIVGVDEANVKKQKIAFVAPIAKAVTGKKVGDKIDFKLGEETRKLEMLKITY
ncbi:GreA/GreB family elongation factor [Salegentibacter salarius]|uniref:Transcription elongation factor GreA n=1 Tax=Salegentibacter salarius TaxID=435906 RepID=A0A2N0U390_9FLAO|nr:GreA/GreB family elongation factor [Salegentibacter salarius]OEY71212.1 transcription elongation factor GreA [Salegentibacter salarius]PKD21366.1 transcription elongation factor GreA [Salegentibacter salarius]SLJ93027.1 transcription elongation factor GreB [Salegentibacter salarius]